MPPARRPQQPKPPRVAPGGPTPKQLGLSFGARGAYNPLSGPRTQGDFNRQLFNAAQAQYQPLLQGVAGDVTSENTANAQRTSDVGDIYGKAQSDAQKAFNEAQAALHQLIAGNATTNDNARATLSAALQAASGNTKSLSDMLGGAAVPGAAGDAPYNAAALAQSTNQENFLNNLAASSTTAEGQLLADPGIERASAMDTESKRHQAAMTGLTNNRNAIIAQIPSIIEKERQSLIQSLQSGEGLAFQQGLAEQQFGLSKQQQQFTQGLQNRQFGEQVRTDTANINSQQEQNRIQAILAKNTIARDQTTLTDEANKAKGQQEANAIAQIQQWIQPTAQELISKSGKTTDAQGNVTNTSTKTVNAATWHRDAGAELLLLMTQFGLTEERALQLMSGLTTPLGGRNGTTTIGEWARTFKQRAAANKSKTTQGNRAVTGAVGQGTRKFTHPFGT